ncbi:hypothetical protein JZ751_013981, partial [Albula glossodonta]
TIESSVCAPPLPVPDKAPPLPLPDKAPPLPVPDKAPPPPVPDKAPAPPVPDKAPPLPVPDKAPPPPTLDKAPPLPVPHKAPPTQAWQVTRQHAGLIEKQAQELGQGEGSTPRGRGTDAEPSIPWRSLREEIRRTNQQRSMAEQRRRLIEQRQQITQLLEEQRMLGQRTLAQRSTHRPPAKPRSTLPKAAAPKISLPPQSCPLISDPDERGNGAQAEGGGRAKEERGREEKGGEETKERASPGPSQSMAPETLPSLLDAGCSRLLGHAVALEMQAERFCRIQTLRRTLRALLDHVTQEKFAAWDREEQARQHWHTCVVRRCLWAWQRLPSLLREEQEREVRREQLRRRLLGGPGVCPLPEVLKPHPPQEAAPPPQEAAPPPAGSSPTPLQEAAPPPGVPRNSHSPVERLTITPQSDL